MNTLNVTFTYEVKGHEELNSTFEHEFSDGNTSKEDLLTAIAESINEDVAPDETDKEIEASDIILTGIESYIDIHKKYDSTEDIFKYAEIFCECEQDAEVVNAAIDCDIQGSDIDEAYNGSYASDEDFAQETAESLGAIDKNAAWPMNCIDWDHAAKELMYDYSESNGHYFRNL